MVGNWVMTDTDIRALLGVFERCQPAADDDIFYADVLTGLRELIPCDDITFQLMDVAEQRIRLLFVTDEGVQREESVGAHRRVHPAVLAGVLGGGRLRRPARDRRLLHAAPSCGASRTRAYANSPLGSAFAALGVKDEILVPMTPLGGTDRRLLLFRDEGSPDFSEREKAMLALARPHIAELHTRRDRELRGEPHLTPRQWEVLRQVATGASNTQIARTSGSPTRRCASTSRTSSSASTCRAGPRPWLASSRSSTWPSPAAGVRASRHRHRIPVWSWSTRPWSG